METLKRQLVRLVHFYSKERERERESCCGENCFRKKYCAKDCVDRGPGVIPVTELSLAATRNRIIYKADDETGSTGTRGRRSYHLA